MASSSSPTDQQQLRDEDRQEDHPPPLSVKDCIHKTKTIHFLGRTTPIVLQNDNGPCPLLAICQCISHPRVSSFLYCLSSTKFNCVSHMEFPLLCFSFLHHFLLLSIPSSIYCLYLIYVNLDCIWLFLHVPLHSTRHHRLPSCSLLGPRHSVIWLVFFFPLGDLPEQVVS